MLPPTESLTQQILVEHFINEEDLNRLLFDANIFQENEEEDLLHGFDD
jgi:hypothetical protein